MWDADESIKRSYDEHLTALTQGSQQCRMEAICFPKRCFVSIGLRFWEQHDGALTLPSKMSRSGDSLKNIVLSIFMSV
jgi:hypothetical protein